MVIKRWHYTANCNLTLLFLFLAFGRLAPETSAHASHSACQPAEVAKPAHHTAHAAPGHHPHHFSHFRIFVNHLIDFLYGSAAALGNALAPRRIQDVVVAPLI